MLEQLKQLLTLPLEEIANHLKLSKQEALNLLVKYNLFRGKTYQSNCPHCEKESTLNRVESTCTFDHSTRSSYCEEIFTLTNTNSVKYNGNSILQQEWLSCLDNSQGLIRIKNSDIKISYTLGSTEYGFSPLFEVEWETGLKWIVDIVDFLEESFDVYNKRFEAAKVWAKQNGFHYRLITNGKLKYSTWSTVHTAIKSTTIPSYEWMMMNHASSWAMLSPSGRLQVGAVISSPDMDQIYAFGYNGDELGGSNLSTCFDSDTFVHAEENCLLKCKTSQSAIMFITHSPCFRCAQKIINAKNIKEVYYLVPYRDMSGTGLLVQHGIPVYHFHPTTSNGEILSSTESIKHLIPRALQ